MKKWVLWFVMMVWLVGCTPPMAEESFEGVLATRGTTAQADVSSLADVISTEPDLAFFLGTLNSTGVMAQLQDGGPYTIFAPSNEAFTKLGMATTQIDPEVLREMMLYHIAFGQMASAELTGTAESLAAQPLTFSSNGDAVLVDGYAQVTRPDLVVAEGVIHIVDSLLLPPEMGAEKSLWGVLVDDGRFSTLVDLLAGSDTMYTLRFSHSPDAYLAPTDDAFAQLDPTMLDRLRSDAELRDMVFNKYYILAPDAWPDGEPLLTTDIAQMDHITTRIGRYGYRGEEISVETRAGELYIAGAQVVAGDLMASNGIVHGIDTAVIPQAASDQ
ncbi:MAG: fasciclin domain-containing protein [Anaerolineales bacterium]|nr:fasciclin domain-containing protein [Anaerolineales bacterium]